MKNSAIRIPRATARILLIDRELGFVWAVSEELRKLGIDAIPSHSVAEAQTLLAEIQPELSLLLIDCRCPGACAFVEELLRAHPGLAVIGLASGQKSCRQCAHRFSATFPAEDRMPERIAHCAATVRRLMANTAQLPI